jgi:hypothetical protein
MPNPILEPVSTFDLQHNSDCSLLGIARDGSIYIEEMYGDGLLSQADYRPDGTLIACTDEGDDERTFRPLPLPADLSRPRAAVHALDLNYSGPRHRGVRGMENTPDLMQALSIQDRMALAARLPVAPPTLFGLAESTVLAEAPIAPDLFIVCRRIRVAYVLEEKRDADNLPYDYDTAVLYIAHRYQPGQDEAALFQALDAALPGLARPMDCLRTGEYLILADGGEGERRSRVHVWRVLPDGPSSGDGPETRQ